MFEFFRWLQRAYTKYHLSYVLPFVILISYTLFGAAIFRSLELERDLNERELFRQSYYYAYDQITRRILELRCEDEVIKRDSALQLQYAQEAVNWFLDYLNITSVIIERNASSPWSWYGSMFYAGQLYTTIGYGLPVAKTLAGQIASIFYIMFGIPIFLIILKDVGQLLSRSFRKFYKRLRSTHRKSSESFRKMKISMKALYNRTYSQSSIEKLYSLPKKEPLEMDPEADALMQKKKKFAQDQAFPIPIALALLILWIGLSAALFCLYEREWGYLTSVYFFFVSISTVGLGDIVPGNKDMMLGYFLLILIGLALLSMCINLIQVALERILGQLLQEYIDEIERVAAMAKNEVDFEAETAPFEVGMASGLLTVPLSKHHKAMRGLPRRMKDWLAERIANNVLVSQLPEAESDVESDSETSISSEQQRLPEQQQQLRRGTEVSRDETPSPRSHFRHTDLLDRLRKHISAIRTVQALEKTKFFTPNDDFQSVLFNKFVTNSKLERYVDQVCETVPLVNHVATQTDFFPPRMFASPEKDLLSTYDSRDSWSVQSHPQRLSTYSTSNSSDAESLLSSAYYDIQFVEPNSPLTATADDIASIDGSAASSQLQKVSPDRPPDPASHQKPKMCGLFPMFLNNSQHSTERPRPRSYQGPMPIRSNSAAVALRPPPTSYRFSRYGTSRLIGSFPSSFRRFSSQSASSLLPLRTQEGDPQHDKKCSRI